MRLNQNKISAIKESITEYLPESSVYLFGSRLDDTKKGGDIDLLVHTKHKPDRKTKAKIRSKIWERIGEQKIDLVFDYPGSSNLFIDLIKLEAQQL
jgi:uncharacterized protein